MIATRLSQEVHEDAVNTSVALASCANNLAVYLLDGKDIHDATFDDPIAMMHDMIGYLTMLAHESVSDLPANEYDWIAGNIDARGCN